MKNEKKWDNTDAITYLTHLFILQFTDVKSEKNKEIATYIFNSIEKKESDKQIFSSIYHWYKSLLESDKKGWPMTDNAFRKYKISSIQSILGSEWIKKNRRSLLVDVGAGDCYITKMVSEITDMSGIAVDIDTNIDWGYEKRNFCGSVIKIVYKGDDLYSQIHGKYPNEKISLIMYNHSLHHFNSKQAIQESIVQAHKLLSPDGRLLIREHDNQDMDIDINLQHILISLRQVMDHNPKWTISQVQKYMDLVKQEFQSHYLTSQELSKIVNTAGFHLIKKIKSDDFPNKYRPDDYWEMSNAYYYIFKPKTNKKTRKRIKS